MKSFLEKYPALYKAVFKLYELCRNIFRINTKTVLLSKEGRSEKHLEEMYTDPLYSNVIKDVEEFTGLTGDDLKKRLMLEPEYTNYSEFKWHSPKSHNELTWFYRCCYSYLYDNAGHHFWKKLDFVKPEHGRILEYAGGIGHNTIPLAERGCEVDYLEIGIIQSAFVRYRLDKRGLKNVNFVNLYVDGKFDPVNCVTEKYGVIILQDVLEHIPNYHIVLRHLIDHLEPNGYILEQTPFEEDVTADDIDIHLRPSMPMEEAMVGMKKIERNIWQKVS